MSNYFLWWRDEKKEFCCTRCGLIWLDKRMKKTEVTCPECGNRHNFRFAIYACNTTEWLNAKNRINEYLKSRDLELHNL